MQLKPLYSHVVIKPIDQEAVTKSGIILPDTASKERPEQGEVIAVGPGRINDNGQITPLSVKIGNRVMFKKYAPDEIKVDNEDYLVIKEEDIMLILE